jgi:hypothetical protein
VGGSSGDAGLHERHGWKVNFGRHIAATNTDLVWRYDPHAATLLDSSNWASISVALTRRAPSWRNYAIYPFLLETAGKDRNVFETSPGSFTTEQPRNFGVDAVVPLSSTLSLVGAYHPDFSNADIDQATIAPQEFQRFLTEYRPFFAQGASFLTPDALKLSLGGAPDQIFYSPAIGSVDHGEKVEGTVGQFSLGALNVAEEGGSDSVFSGAFSNGPRTQNFWLDGVLASRDNINDQTVEMGGLVKTRSKELAIGFDVAHEATSVNGLLQDGTSFQVASYIGDTRGQLTIGATNVKRESGGIAPFGSVAGATEKRSKWWLVS